MLMGCRKAPILDEVRADALGLRNCGQPESQDNTDGKEAGL